MTSRFDDCIDKLAKLRPGLAKAYAKNAKVFESEFEKHATNLDKELPHLTSGARDKLALQMAMHSVNAKSSQRLASVAHNASIKKELASNLENRFSKDKTVNLYKMMDDTKLRMQSKAANILNLDLPELQKTFHNLPFNIDRLMINNEPLAQQIVKAHGGKSVDAKAQLESKRIKMSMDQLHKEALENGVLMPKLTTYLPAIEPTLSRINRLGLKEFIQDKVKHTDWELYDQLKDNMPGLHSSVEGYQQRQIARIQEHYDKKVQSNINGSNDFALMKNEAQNFKDIAFGEFPHKDVNTWVEQKDKWSPGTTYGKLIGHLQRQAQSLALLSKWGHNPYANFRELTKLAALDKGVNLQTKGLEYKVSQYISDPTYKTPIKTMEGMWREMIGQSHEVGNNPTAAAIAEINKAVVTGALIPGSYFTLLTDFASSAVGTHLLHINFMQYFGNYLKDFAKLSSEQQRGWMRQFTTLNDLYNRSMQDNVGIYTEGENFSGVTKLAKTTSEGMVRIGFHNHDYNTKRSNMEVMLNHEYAIHKDVAYNDLPSNMRESLRMFNIDEDQWKSIQKSVLYQPESFARYDHMIDLKELRKNDTKAYNNFIALTGDAALWAVPESDLSSNTTQSFNGRNRSDWGRIFMSPIYTFMSYGLTMLRRNVEANFLDPRALGNKSTMSLRFMAAGAIFGLLSVSLRELAFKGELPDYSKPEIYYKAIAKVLGSIYVDRIESIEYRKKAGKHEDSEQALINSLYAMSGAQYQMDIKGAGVIRDMIKAEVTDDPKDWKTFKWDAAKFAQHYHPGSRLWYTNKIESQYFNELFKNIDPGHQAAIDKLQTKSTK